MKHYFKKLTVFRYICFVMIFYGCTHEKDFVNEQNHSKVKFEQRTFDEVLKIPIFNEVYQKVVKRKLFFNKSAEAKTALEDEYGFTIDPEVVKIIEEQDGTKTYNMLILRDSIKPEYFENLVIQIDDMNNVDCFIMKYIPNEESKYIEFHDSYIFEGEKEIQQIVDSGKAMVNTLSNGCFYTSLILCYNCPDGTSWTKPHSPGIECTNPDYLYTFSSDITCPSSVGDMDVMTGTTTTTTTTSGENGGGANGGSINTVTVPPCRFNCVEADIVKTPCEELQNLFKRDTIINPNTPEVDTLKYANLKPKIQIIRNYVNSASEYGYELEYKQLLDKYDTNFLEGGGALGNFALSIPIGYYGYGGIHSHPNDSYSIPSFGDLVWIRDCYNDSTTKEYNKSKIVSIIVVRNPNGGTPLTYALKIDNFTTFNQNINDRLSTISEGTIGKKILKIHEQNGVAYESSTNLEKTFLEMFQSCGFSLYKANDALTTWDKLELIPGTTDGIVNPIPCNN